MRNSVYKFSLEEMADTNPLDDLFRTDTDVNAVNELVASLESKLASPTNNDHSLSISTPSVNCNHAIGTSTNSACTNVLITAQNNNVQLTNNTGSINNAVSKKDNQILGINSIHSNSPITIVNSPANSQRSVSPKPLNSVNKPASPSVQISSQAQNQGIQTLVGNVRQINSATPPPSQSVPTNNLCPGTTNVKLISNSNTLASNSSAIVIQSDSASGNLNRSSPGIINSNVHGSVKSTQGIVVNSVVSQPMTKKTNVHIVHNVSSNASQAISTQSVITVRGQAPVSQMSNVRPQVVTSHINSSSPRPQATNVRIQQTRMQNAPIRIASTQPNQINIAPRPGVPPGTITLPPGLVPNQGNAVLMKNEHGQIVIVQPGNLPHQPASTVTISSSSTPQKVQYVRHANSGTTQRVPTGQILTIQPGQSQPQTIVRQAVPAPINTAKQQSGVRVTIPQNIQTVVRSSTPGQAASHTGPSSGQSTGGPGAVQQQQMLENVKKCKNFLSTLIKLAASQPEATVSSVRDLIQGLIDGKLEPEVFTERLQKELKSSPQPYLVPFLKKSLPLLRQSLLNNKMTIDGVRPPPLEIVQQQVPVSIVPATQPSVQQTVLKTVQPSPVQPKARVPLVTTNRKHVIKQPHQVGGNVPSTVKAFQHKVTGLSASPSPGPSHSQKEKKKFETLKDDDDINDVATMGGVNLSEESRNILATNADFIGTQIRSCKDESFLFHGTLLSRITAIAKKHGLTEVPSEVVNLVSHATQERLREIVEKLSVIAEQRSEIYKINEKFESSTDVKSQLKFLEELDVLERKRHDEQEKEMLRRAAKSRSKHEDPEHLKLKQRAKDLQQAEMEEVRQREANLTALAAIGPRKKRKLDTDTPGSSTGSGMLNGPASSARSSLRPRIKRVNLRDLLFLMEQDKTLDKSNLLYRTFLK